MALKMEVTCSRCNRTDSRTVDSVAAAQAFEAREKKKGERLKEIAEFFSKIPAEELPDFMVVGGEGGLLHVNLCDPEGEDSKRSCKKRVHELIKQAGKLEERKPRTKKETAAEPAAEEKKAE